MPSKTVLVIDDDAVMLKIIEETLKENEFSVVTATDGLDGLDLVRTINPDAVILDRNMPGLSGDETLKILKDDPDTKNIPVVMLTGQNSISEVSKCLEMGARDYIVKPFDANNLIVRLKQALN